jgi:peptidoglycan DL-endopeptidase CwlO
VTLPGPSQGAGNRRGLVIGLVVGGLLLIFVFAGLPALMFTGSGLLYETGTACSNTGSGSSAQPAPSATAVNSIPANYLALFKSTGRKYHVPWVVLAGIGKVESNDGQSDLPGVHSGANPYGAAGPMQIGIGGAAGDEWGGAAVHPASEKVNGVATDADGRAVASVYDPADAIAGAAKYLLEHGVLDNIPQAIFAYNHLWSYVQTVLSFAALYARGGYTVGPATAVVAEPACIAGVGQAPNNAAANAIAYAENQVGKPYQWGATGPDAFDCSGLTMAAYRAAGIDIPRTAAAQWRWGPRVRPSQVKPGDLVFFAGADGTAKAPGHVGIVIGGGMMVEAYATGFPVRIAPYGSRNPIGFTRPWAHKAKSSHKAGSHKGRRRKHPAAASRHRTT